MIEVSEAVAAPSRRPEKKWEKTRQTKLDAFDEASFQDFNGPHSNL